MSYLNQSANNGATYCKVVTVKDDNYAIFVGGDTSIITCEKVSSPPGVYMTDNLELQIVDPEITNVVDGWYGQNAGPGRDLLGLAMDLINQSGTSVYKPVNSLPKLNKGICSSLSSIKELMTIYETDIAFEFLCFGYRKPIAEFLEQNAYRSFYFFPERFYIASSYETRYKANIRMSYLEEGDAIAVTNPDGDKISFAKSVVWRDHMNFLARSFTDD